MHFEKGKGVFFRGSALQVFGQGRGEIRRIFCFRTELISVIKVINRIGTVLVFKKKVLLYKEAEKVL